MSALFVRKKPPRRGWDGSVRTPADVTVARRGLVLARGGLGRPALQVFRHFGRSPFPHRLPGTPLLGRRRYRLTKVVSQQPERKRRGRTLVEYGGKGRGRRARARRRRETRQKKANMTVSLGHFRPTLINGDRRGRAQATARLD
uniref:Uncharacterized protein n=1 Tax=Plectus sambesii TaxID=2011161 RepID=A0A914VJ15_9BILA